MRTYQVIKNLSTGKYLEKWNTYTDATWGELDTAYEFKFDKYDGGLYVMDELIPLINSLSEKDPTKFTIETIYKK